MDIQYLLFLQEFRNSIHDALTPFMEWISLFGLKYLIMIPVFIYWALDRKKGFYAISSFCICIAVNAVIKLSVCAYRPWIRDSRVLPAGDSIRTATGYSFPSGHTSTASPLYGGLAVSSWKKWKWLSGIWIVLLLITGFSRNYLGVHTPQDVVVGVLLSVLTLFLNAKLLSYLSEHPDRVKWFQLGGFLLGWAAILYITLKPYPMTYVDGKLLVDPKVMMNDGYRDITCLTALCVSTFVERRWIRFRPTGLNAKGILICGAGLIVLWAIIRYLTAPLDQLLGGNWGHLVSSFIQIFYCLALFPLVIKLSDRQEKSEESDDAPVEEAQAEA